MLLVVLFASMFAFGGVAKPRGGLKQPSSHCANRFLPLQVARNDDGESADGLVHHGEAV